MPAGFALALIDRRVPAGFALALIDRRVPAGFALTLIDRRVPTGVALALIAIDECPRASGWNSSSMTRAPRAD